MHPFKCISAALILLQLPWCVSLRQTKAVMLIKLSMYENAAERRYDGYPCDALWIGQCDPEFHLCVADYNNDNEVTNCPYYKNVTGKYANQNIVRFDIHHLIGGIENPMIVNFKDGWPGRVNFKVKVIDRDDFDGHHDYVDTTKATLELDPAKSESEASWRAIVASGLRSQDTTSLSFWYLLYCLPNYYGPNCATFCEPQNSQDTGFYTCDPDTGDKVCRPGYEVPECLEHEDDCIDNACQNGAICVDHYKYYSCACLPGFVGNLCQIDINNCAQPRCQNGGSCVDLVNAYRCDCPEGYSGTNCEEHVCDDPTLCLNGGSCYGNGECQCMAQFSGPRCEDHACDNLVCHNGAACNRQTGSCVCLSGFLGKYCQTGICEVYQCNNGGTCLGNTCACPAGYTGTFCEWIINECTSDPCLNEGSCFDQLNGYRCKCAIGYTGEHCENQIPQTLPPTPPTVAPVSDVDVTNGSTPATAPPKVLRARSDDENIVVPTWTFGVVGGVLAFIILLIIIIVLVTKYRRKKRQLRQQTQQQTNHQTVEHGTRLDPLFLHRQSDRQSSQPTPRIENVYDSPIPTEPQYVNEHGRGTTGFAYVVPTVHGAPRKTSMTEESSHPVYASPARRSTDPAPITPTEAPALPPRQGSNNVYAIPPSPKPVIKNTDSAEPKMVANTGFDSPATSKKIQKKKRKAAADAAKLLNQES